MNEVKNYLKNKLKNGDALVLAVSGGPDSMCLFHLLLEIKKEKNIKIICAHVNHGIRKESIEEKDFVEKYCKKNKCIFEYFELESLEKDNFEAKARLKRYEFFNSMIKKYNANYLITAHHADDLIETILMRLTRGSNLSGYAGFKKETYLDNFELIRPLIYVSKDDILKYNEQNNIEYRLDKTNDSDDYTRNRFRHHILPYLKEENKNVHQKILQFSEDLYLIDEHITKETSNILTNIYVSDKLKLHDFNKLDLIIKKRIIESLLSIEYKDDIYLINNKHKNAILKLCESNKPNGFLDLPKKIRVIKSYDDLYFSKSNDKTTLDIILDNKVVINDYSYITKIENTDIKKSNYIFRLNSKEISLPLRVRNIKIKDKIEVKNLNGSKKVKDIFIDNKIPVEKRRNWPIVVDSNDNILWIPGLKKSKFDKNIDDFYDIIYKYVVSEGEKNE